MVICEYSDIVPPGAKECNPSLLGPMPSSKKGSLGE